MTDKKLNLQSLLIAGRAQPDTAAQFGRPRSLVGRATRLLGGLMVAASLLPTHASAADSVKIGVLLPLTGPVADTGNNSR